MPGMTLHRLPDGTIVEVHQRPPIAQPTVHKLGVGGPDGCMCQCHDHPIQDPLFDSCDECFDTHFLHHVLRRKGVIR